jgi:hypothetical protein
MRISLGYLYSEGKWRYYRVLVDDEQAGYVAINDTTHRIGKTAHHPWCYPNEAVMRTIAEERTKKRKVEYTLARG